MATVREATHPWAEQKKARAADEPALLPDPEPRDRTYTIISVDDHLVEPRHLFEGRMPAHLADAAPKVITNDAQQELWLYEDVLYPQIGLNAISGRPKDQWNMEPARFDEMRRGCWDVDARVHDMDLDGVYASLCFPSLIAGLRRRGVLPEQGPGARTRVRAGMERLAPRGVGRAPPRPHHPAPDPVALRPADRRRPTSARTRRAASRP